MDHNQPATDSSSSSQTPHIPLVKRPRRQYNKAVHGKRLSPSHKLAIKAEAIVTGDSVNAIAVRNQLHPDTVKAIIEDSRVAVLKPDQLDILKASMIGSWHLTGKRALSAITDDKLEQASALQLATVAGISTDKARLMEDKSTSNVSHRGVIEHIDGDREQLMNKLQALGDA